MNNLSTNNRTIRTVCLFVVPVALVIFGTLLYPICSSIVMSFTNKIFQFHNYSFVGFQNYVDAFADPLFWLALKNSLKLALIVVTGDLIIGFPIAILLNQDYAYNKFFRVILFIPWLIPSTVTATIFRWIFNSYYGFFNYYVLKIGIANEPIEILGDEKLVWVALSASIIWGSFPFVTLVLAASLKSINHNLYEAAKLDGANGFQMFRWITIPSIRSSLVTIVILELIWEISDYDMVKLMTNGGPYRSTYTLSLYIFNKAFEEKSIGYAGAVGMIFFFIIFSLTMIFMKVAQERNTNE